MPRTSSNSTQPHNRTRPAKRVSRVTLSTNARSLAGWLSPFIVLRKTVIGRRYGRNPANTTSGTSYYKPTRFTRFKAMAFIDARARTHKSHRAIRDGGSWLSGWGSAATLWRGSLGQLARQSAPGCSPAFGREDDTRSSRPANTGHSYHRGAARRALPYARCRDDGRRSAAWSAFCLKVPAPEPRPAQAASATAHESGPPTAQADSSQDPPRTLSKFQSSLTPAPIVLDDRTASVAFFRPVPEKWDGRFRQPDTDGTRHDGTGRHIARCAALGADFETGWPRRYTAELAC
jgi:hypothetical protein